MNLSGSRHGAVLMTIAGEGEKPSTWHVMESQTNDREPSEKAPGAGVSGQNPYGKMIQARTQGITTHRLN